MQAKMCVLRYFTVLLYLNNAVFHHVIIQYLMAVFQVNLG